MISATRPKLDRGYEVEWHSSCPRDGAGELEIERAECEGERFATLAEAQKYAASVVDRDCFGSVLIRDFYWQEYDDDGIPYFDYENGSYLEEVS